PSASYVCAELYRWLKVVGRGVAEDKNELTILKAFQYADEIIPTLSVILPICPRDKHTSKLLNFKNLSKPLLKFYGSSLCDFSISDDYYNSQPADIVEFVS
ncbi:34355_t:CDS:2, partial [Gigaspora margarita]